MNWIFEAYANVYQTATGFARTVNSGAAPAKSSDYERHDSKYPRR